MEGREGPPSPSVRATVEFRDAGTKPHGALFASGSFQQRRTGLIGSGRTELSRQEAANQGERDQGEGRGEPEEQKERKATNEQKIESDKENEAGREGDSESGSERTSDDGKGKEPSPAGEDGRMEFSSPPLSPVLSDEHISVAPPANLDEALDAASHAFTSGVLRRLTRVIPQSSLSSSNSATAMWLHSPVRSALPRERSSYPIVLGEKSQSSASSSSSSSSAAASSSPSTSRLNSVASTGGSGKWIRPVTPPLASPSSPPQASTSSSASLSPSSVAVTNPPTDTATVSEVSVQVKATGNLQLPLLAGLVESDGTGTNGYDLSGFLQAAALVAWDPSAESGNEASGSSTDDANGNGPDMKRRLTTLSKKDVIKQLSRRIKEESGRTGQEGQLDEMLLFCISQFLSELALIVSDHTLYRTHKLLNLNKELVKMVKVVQAVDDSEGAWVQSLKRAKSTLSELPRQMAKDKDGSGSGFGTSSARGKSVEISDLRPSSLEQRMSGHVEQISSRLMEMQKELATGEASLSRKAVFSQVIQNLSKRFEALDKMGYLAQEPEQKEETQRTESEDGLTLPSFVTNLPGEKVSYVAASVKSKLWNGGASVLSSGTLFVTNYQVIFAAEDNQTKGFPIHLIASMEKIGRRKRTMGNDDYGIDFFLKDTRIVRFIFERDSAVYPPPRRMVHTRILKGLIQPVTRLFAFQYYSSLRRTVPPPINGWKIYDAEREYKRLGLPSKRWKISRINRHYSWCPSYPSLLVIPEQFPEEHLPAVLKFRSRNRIPVLTWIHPKHGAAIVRCSQPLTGMQRGRCTEDEQLLASIINTVPKAQQLHIFDARPKANAVANTARGAGYEVLANYQNCSLSFLGVGNIHVIRDSQKKVRDMCHLFVNPMNEDNKWLSALDASQWLSHISLILSSSADVVKFVHLHGEPVVVHCSDGWDRTSQIVSLAQLMLDPYYRTIEGFIVLIEKDWLSFGHQFALRSGHDGFFYSDGQRAPIFMQWVECVWQMQRQYPLAFEFNEKFLLELLHHLHSCRFGTFLYNTEKERIHEKLSQNTESLWTWMLAEKDALQIVNPFYRPANRVLVPNCSLRKMQFWEGYFLQWVNDGVRDSDVNFDHLVLNLLAEKDKQIADLQAQLRDCQQKLQQERENRGESSMKTKSRGIGKMKLLKDKLSGGSAIYDDSEQGDGKKKTKAKAKSKPRKIRKKAEDRADEEESSPSTIVTAGSVLSSVAEAAAESDTATKEDTATVGETSAGKSKEAQQPATEDADSSSPIPSALDDVSPRQEDPRNESTPEQSETPGMRLESGESKWRIGIKN